MFIRFMFIWLMKWWMYQCHMSSSASCMYFCNRDVLKNVPQKRKSYGVSAGLKTGCSYWIADYCIHRNSIWWNLIVLWHVVEKYSWTCICICWEVLVKLIKLCSHPVCWERKVSVCPGLGKGVQWGSMYVLFCILLDPNLWQMKSQVNKVH